mmetsp:Transcript_22580/g.25944  ORF Transcript_22580/g.25944 Transcript_22580/m.25944 type:complete len:281 (+) Transcript_22580:554-1396(+)
MIFVDIISEFSTHPFEKIRNESLKFFVFVAKWNDNVESIQALASKSLKAPQMKKLQKMLSCFMKVAEVKFDDVLADSDDETWYNKDGCRVNRKDLLNNEESNDSSVKIKYGRIFVENVNRTYKWVTRVSKIDEVIFDLVWNRVVEGELVYLTELISSMLNSYNVNVLVKTLKLLGLLILKFKEVYAPYIIKLREPLTRSLSSSKGAFLIEASKVFFYIKKYCFTPDQYIKFLTEAISQWQGVTQCKILVEILLTFIHEDRPAFECFKTVKGFTSFIEDLS